MEACGREPGQLGFLVLVGLFRISRPASRVGSRSLLSESDSGCAHSGSEIVGTPRRDESESALATSREAREARKALAEIYGWFTEGFDTQDLREANTLLAQLS